MLWTGRRAKSPPPPVVRPGKGPTERHHDLARAIETFSETVIREVMVPRTEMVSVGADAPREVFVETFFRAGHSRLPVYQDGVDHIIGVLHVKDLFVAWVKNASPDSAAFDVTKLLRETFFVPESMKISVLLTEFQRRKTHMAIVADEYGGTAGVVTLEDIIEEIVGEIQDEYDIEEKQYRRIGDDAYLCDGRVPLKDLEDLLHVSFPDDHDHEYETLAGFVTAQTGHVPQKGATLEWHHLEFHIKEADVKRVMMVEIRTRKKGLVRNT